MSERARLAWRCRRGMLELDLLLGGFLDRGYDGLKEHQRQLFCAMLEWPDQELLAQLLGQQPPKDGEYVEIIAAIRRAAAP